MGNLVDRFSHKYTALPPDHPLVTEFNTTCETAKREAAQACDKHVADIAHYETVLTNMATRVRGRTPTETERSEVAATMGILDTCRLLQRDAINRMARIKRWEMGFESAQRIARHASHEAQIVDIMHRAKLPKTLDRISRTAVGTAERHDLEEGLNDIRLTQNDEDTEVNDYKKDDARVDAFFADLSTPKTERKSMSVGTPVSIPPYEYYTRDVVRPPAAVVGSTAPLPPPTTRAAAIVPMISPPPPPLASAPDTRLPPPTAPPPTLASPLLTQPLVIRDRSHMMAPPVSAKPRDLNSLLSA